MKSCRARGSGKDTFRSPSIKPSKQHFYFFQNKLSRCFKYFIFSLLLFHKLLEITGLKRTLDQTEVKSLFTSV